MSDTRNTSLKIPAANNRYMRWAVGLVMPLTVLGACQGGGTSGDEASQFNSDQASETVNIGFLYDVHSANVWTLDECESDLDIELTSFKQFAEVQRALEQGHVNAAAMGYQNSAQMLENQYEDFSIVSGVYTGAQHITVRKGSDINDWEDLVGKSVGLPPNSFVEMLFRAALDEAGIDYDDIDTVAFPGAGPPM